MCRFASSSWTDGWRSARICRRRRSAGWCWSTRPLRWQASSTAWRRLAKGASPLAGRHLCDLVSDQGPGRCLTVSRRNWRTGKFRSDGPMAEIRPHDARNRGSTVPAWCSSIRLSRWSEMKLLLPALTQNPGAGSRRAGAWIGWRRRKRPLDRRRGLAQSAAGAEEIDMTASRTILAC